MSFPFSDYDDELLFVPLGGSNEIGMNLNLYRYRGKWLMIDLGIGFADDYLPGVEIIVPNIDAILPYKKDLLGLVVTHAHEDHLGGVPYLWQELGCPIYTTPFTGALLKAKFKDEGITQPVELHEVVAGKHYALGPFSFEMVPVTHSIPEMHAVALRTDQGTVMHTGDWELDANPLVGVTTDEKTLERYGDEGVLAMVCDSTNVFVEGESGSELEVRQNLKKVIESCENRVVVTLFASNVARLESVVYAALDAGRQVALAGRSLWRMVGAAQESGYLQDVPPFLEGFQGMELRKEQVCFIVTGCQGESRAALAGIAKGEHPEIRLTPGDTVIFSSRSIPGNESKIGWMYNKLVLAGIEVITDKQVHIHVSGHPARAELARMYQLVRPQIAIPVHGEARHIHEHAKYARNLQVPEAVEATNGAVIRMKPGEAGVIGMVDWGYIAIDGTSLIATDSAVIRTRRKLRDDGCCVVSAVYNAKGKILSMPRLSALGCLDPVLDKEMIEALREDIAEAIEQNATRVPESRLHENIRTLLRRYFNKELGKKPVLDIQLHRVA